MISDKDFHQLEDQLEGELQWDDLHRTLFSTDASVYKKKPLAVCFPKTEKDLKQLLRFANEKQVSLVARTAGTSLAGQVVGEGLIVDLSRHFTNIIHFDPKEGTVEVQPGVIRDELNAQLKDYGWFFGPNTSTSNRCMIGGMVGNNSSGTTSIKYGVTRDHVMEMKVLLANGEELYVKAMDAEELEKAAESDTRSGAVYAKLIEELSKPEVQENIRKGFPKKSIHRRNNGYAVDALLDMQPFTEGGSEFNLAKLLCGSEGTLAITTSIKLKLSKLPPENKLLVAAHFESIDESMRAVVTAMKHDLYMCELMDKTILDCTKNNREQAQNRFFVEGDPRAVLMMELCAEDERDVQAQAENLIEDLKKKGLGYAFPILAGTDIQKAFELRKAGLGLLGNLIGDRKAVACIEDTAVDVEDLPAYIAEFSQMMSDFGQEAVYYAHAGAGELHLRPILNLKKSEDLKLFKEITAAVAELVQKYQGALSGEHGDGIVRSEFLSATIGKDNYELIRSIKNTFDPDHLLNPGKIVDPWPMDSNLRYAPDREEPELKTLMDFSEDQGILRLAEKCNGSGDCRKTGASGGTMCPSYRATKDEKDSTRARANALREYLTRAGNEEGFHQKELKEVFDLCLSCKACASECPSNVDVAALKAEFLFQHQKKHGLSLRSRIFGENDRMSRLGSKAAPLTNFFLGQGFVKGMLGIAQNRSMPQLHSKTSRRWYKKHQKEIDARPSTKGRLYLFLDEFTNYYDPEIGIDAIEVLSRLGYEVRVTSHKESGRALISKGMLDKAKRIANFNVSFFQDKISAETPLVGLEPSAVLTFRDEYLRLSDQPNAAKALANHCFTLEEFMQREIEAGRIVKEDFSDLEKSIKIHGHCHQKSLSNMKASLDLLNFPENFSATLMNTGCCGMAGSFGFEKEHYELSMKIGEESLFPKVRSNAKNCSFAASGTSCRHQILDGTQIEAKHPISLLAEALK